MAMAEQTITTDTEATKSVCLLEFNFYYDGGKALERLASLNHCAT